MVVCDMRAKLPDLTEARGRRLNAAAVIEAIARVESVGVGRIAGSTTGTSIQEAISYVGIGRVTA